jgi:hypothetical protein
MYVSGNTSGYDGLGHFWGETKASEKAVAKVEAAVEAKIAAKAKAVAKAKAGGMPDPSKEVAKVLPPSAVVDAKHALLRDPQDFIPKPKTIVNAHQAMQILTRKGGPQSKKTKGKVYWTASGPKFSSTIIPGGRTAETVTPPVIKLRPNVSVVRDLPTVQNLEPIEAKAAPDATLKGFFGEATSSKWSLILVLGLLFIIVRSYNKS